MRTPLLASLLALLAAAEPAYNEIEGCAATRGEARLGVREMLLYLGAGALLGIVFVKSELTSW